MRKLEEPFEFQNAEEDFQISYRNAGKFDIECLMHRYQRLTNAPKNLLQQRFTVYQW